MKEVINSGRKSSIIKCINGKKVFKIANIMMLALAFVFCISGYGAYASDLSSTPFGAIINGVTNLSKGNTIFSTSKAKITLDTSMSKDPSVKMVSDIIKSISVESKSKVNKEAKEAFYDMTFMINESIKVDSKIYIKDKDIVIFIPQLYSRPICYNLDELAKMGQVSGVEVKTFNWDDYKSLLNMNESKEFKDVKQKYGQILFNSINQLIEDKGQSVLNTENSKGEKLAINCNQYKLKMTLNDVSSILNGLLTKFAEDNNLKNLIKIKLEEFFAIMEKNGDYNDLDLNKEKKSAIDNFDKGYNKAIDSLKEAIVKINEVCEASITSNILIDSNNVLRGSNNEINLTFKDLLSLNISSQSTINSINENMNITPICTEDALNLSKASEKEIEEMMNEIQSKAVNVFSSLRIFNK